jgi:hypothetical protein
MSGGIPIALWNAPSGEAIWPTVNEIVQPFAAKTGAPIEIAE